MLPRTPKHDFLDRLHDLVKPRRYLEIGVQTGTSLALARAHTAAVGVDPNPMVDRGRMRSQNYIVYPVTSDEFFANCADRLDQPVDLAFIDGMHLIEYVLRDFTNVEEWMSPGGIIALDDVLPYSPDIAGRVPLPGDWAGDVWKLWPILTKWRPDLKITMVDVAPTGLMVVQHLDPGNGPATLRGFYNTIVDTWAIEVPGALNWLNLGALQPSEALGRIAAIQDLHDCGPVPVIIETENE